MGCAPCATKQGPLAPWRVYLPCPRAGLVPGFRAANVRQPQKQAGWHRSPSSVAAGPSVDEPCCDVPTKWRLSPQGGLERNFCYASPPSVAAIESSGDAGSGLASGWLPVCTPRNRPAIKLSLANPAAADARCRSNATFSSGMLPLSIGFFPPSLGALAARAACLLNSQARAACVPNSRGRGLPPRLGEP